MPRILVVLALSLVMLLGFSGTASSTIYFGTGAAGGYFRSWYEGGWRDLWLSFEGPMRVDLDQRLVEDPDWPGTFLTEIDFSAATPRRVSWGFDDYIAPTPAALTVGSGGFVPRTQEPPGYGPMSLYLGDIWGSGFVLVHGVNPVGNSLDFQTSLAQNGWSVGLSFSGTAVPEPMTIALLAAAIAAAGPALRRRRT